MALKKCNECGKEVSSKAASCPNCGAPVKRSSSIGCSTIIAGIFVFGMIWYFLIVDKSDKSTTYSPTSSVPKVSTTPYNVQPFYDPIQKWGKEKVDSAQKVMLLARKDCQIYEEDSHLVVKIGMYINNPNELLKYVSAIADADVILQGEPRNIYFYDPSNRKIAQADTLKGIRLID